MREAATHLDHGREGPLAMLKRLLPDGESLVARCQVWIQRKGNVASCVSKAQPELQSLGSDSEAVLVVSKHGRCHSTWNTRHLLSMVPALSSSRAHWCLARRWNFITKRSGQQPSAGALSGGGALLQTPCQSRSPARMWQDWWTVIRLNCAHQLSGVIGYLLYMDRD